MITPHFVHCCEPATGGNIPGCPASRRRPPLFKRQPALQPQHSRARHVPDSRPNCSPWITRGEGGPDMGGRAEAVSRSSSCDRRSPGPPVQRPRPLPQDQSLSTPASALRAPDSRFGFRAKLGNYWREEDNYKQLSVYMVICI